MINFIIFLKSIYFNFKICYYYHKRGIIMEEGTIYTRFNYYNDYSQDELVRRANELEIEIQETKKDIAFARDSEQKKDLYDDLRYAQDQLEYIIGLLPKSEKNKKAQEPKKLELNNA